MPKAPYKRASRVADQIRMEVADILIRKSKDPRLQVVTVTEVDLSPDLRLARIYVTMLPQGADEEQVMQGLAKATGYIRGELARRLALRYSPELVFYKDTSGPRGDRILMLLDQLHTAQPEGRSDTDALQSDEPTILKKEA